MLTWTMRKHAFVLLAAAICLGLSSGPVLAQFGGMGKGSDRGSDPKSPTSPGDRKGSGTQGDSGSSKATIVKFDAAKEEEKDEHLGTLTARPDEGKSLRLDVRPDVQVQFGAKTVAAEDLHRVLVPGIRATLEWRSDKVGQRKVKILSRVSFESVVIEGQLGPPDQSKPDLMKIRGKPTTGDWPEQPSRTGAKKPGTGARSGSGSEKTVRAKTLRVRYLENLSTITDDANQNVEFVSLQADQRVQVDIIFGKQYCLLVNAKVTSTGDDSGKEPDKSADARGAG
ncbi:MAG: hypothetical protein L6Q92_10775 [Phycisphaerae bacterium]|nr:hypothetical protein [Phycisphaerae bacterium]